MPEEPFLLVSLEEAKAKALAQVLSNDTARKILDFLSKNDLKTETEISKELGLALSTVHYNLDLLSKTNLVTTDNFTYSEKGKQIIHYSLSNKYVIIAPRKTEGLKEKLKQFLPVVALASGAAAIIKYFPEISQPFTNSAPAAKGVADQIMIRSAEAVPAAAGTAISQPVFQTQEFALWFLFGSVFALLVYFIWAEIILKKIKK